MSPGAPRPSPSGCRQRNPRDLPTPKRWCRLLGFGFLVDNEWGLGGGCCANLVGPIDRRKVDVITGDGVPA